MRALRLGTDMPDRVAKAQHYRARAGDIRAIAEGVADPRARKRLMEVADEYELFAREAEDRSSQNLR